MEIWTGPNAYLHKTLQSISFPCCLNLTFPEEEEKYPRASLFSFFLSCWDGGSSNPKQSRCCIKPKHLQSLPTSRSQCPLHVNLCCTCNEHLALIIGQSKAQLSCTSYTFMPEKLEESIFCHADTDGTTESVTHVELILLIAMFLMPSVPCELGKESRLYACQSTGFRYLQVLSVDILFCIAW